MKKAIIVATLVLLALAVALFFSHPFVQAPASPSAHDSGSQFIASTTNPYFHTYINNASGFSIDIPISAFKDILGCEYVPSRESYQLKMGSSSVPLVAVTLGDSTYIGFEYFFDLVQKESGSSQYTNCLKRHISEYVPIFLAHAPYPNDFTDDEPVSITVKSANTLEQAKAGALQDYNAHERRLFSSQSPPPSICTAIAVASSSASSGIEILTPCDDGYSTIEYSDSQHKLAIIRNGPHQYCPFSADGTPSYFYAPGCFSPLITSSFKFLGD